MSVFLKRQWIRITADRRKFGLFAAVLGVGLLLWARIIVISNVPRTAIADPDGNGQTPVNGVTTVPPLTGAIRTPVRAMVSIQLDHEPRRDPFLLDGRYFPRPTPNVDPGQETNKLDPQRVEDPNQIEARLIASLWAIVGRLKLEAVIAGGPMAVISGRTYRLGEEVPEDDMFEIQFRLVEIRQRSVILDWEGRRFEMKMDSPGD